MIGQTISHYKIVDKIGEGGMSVVYKAEDTRLKRSVALKFLSQATLDDDEHAQRFFQEARAARSARTTLTSATSMKSTKRTGRLSSSWPTSRARA